MPTFNYKARDMGGDAVDGTLVADSEMAAARILHERELMPIDLREIDTDRRSLLGRRSDKVSASRVGVVYEQLADLLNAGVPLLRGIAVLANQTNVPALGRVLREVHDDVSGGDALADSMEKHQNAFPKLHAAMVRAGEKGGFLEDVLQRLSEFVTRQDELKNKFIGAMAYPCILVTVLIGAVTVIMTWVVPRIRPLLEGQVLPLPTVMVFAIADALTQHYLLILGGVLLVIIGIAAFVQSERGQQLRDHLALKAWGFGPIYTMVSLCRFCRIFGTLLANGIAIIQALEIAKDSAGNRILAETIHNAGENVRHGEPLTEPLSASKLFPPAIIDMIAVAEESNTLDKTLIQVANTQEARTGRQIDLFVRMLEPLLLLVAAGMVLFIAVALLLPILTMATQECGSDQGRGDVGTKGSAARRVTPRGRITRLFEAGYK